MTSITKWRETLAEEFHVFLVILANFEMEEIE